MKLKILIPVGFCLAILFSSCLKDTPFMDVSNTKPVIEFGLSAASGNFGPFRYKGDTTSATPTDTAIALVVAAPQPLGTTVTATVAVDPSQIDAFNAANGTSYTLLPSNLYTLTTSITIAPGYSVGSIPVSFNFANFPQPHRYALPLVIVGAKTNGDTLIVSPNSNTFMWLFK